MQAMVKLVLAVSVALTLNACSKFRQYDGPEVTRVVVMKSSRQMHLLHGNEVLASYKIDLGFAPDGPKQIEGDGKTPEGSYFIDRRNPNSEFHLSLGINYPNKQDIENAQKMGKSPGGDIFIHGGPKRFRDRNKPDWTFGCISVSNREIEQIYAMVQDGTQVDILP
ncbi:MAG: L,D-transpeptidase family protein [Rhodobacteraceae bacterium]|nr:L,D-transpeptidase family protein [Paracoccaceae bacterium]